MPPRGALVPARFLALTAHLVLLLHLGGTGPPPPPPPDLWPEELDPPPHLFWGALGGALALLGVEFLGFFAGVSMFHAGQGLLSVGAHAGAALSLALLEGGGSGCLWLLFALCSVPPAITELLLLLAVLGCRKRRP